MAIYQKMLPDSKIFKGVDGLKSVMILGCGLCLNDALGFDTDYPLARIEVNTDTGERNEVPVAVGEESNRLKSILENKGINANIEIPRFPVCLIIDETEKAMSELPNRFPDAEAIIALCCPPGVSGLKRCLTKRIKIVPAAKTLGIFQICKVVDESKGLVYMDRSRSTRFLMFKEKQQ